MYENLIYCLNATVPIFLLMVLGTFLKKAGLFNDATASKLNGYVFKAALPVMLFEDLSQTDFFSFWDSRFVLYSFAATLISIIISIAASLAIKDRPVRGEFIQGSYRSSVALLGAAFLQNIYGRSEAVSLLLIGAVPLYNVAAVAALAITSPENTEQNTASGTRILRTLKGIITNPIILSILIGLIWSLIDIPQPVILKKTVSSVAATATPLGLMALGASFKLEKTAGHLKQIFSATALKLIGFGVLFVPVAIALGFRDDKLVAALAMLASPATVSGYVMARNLGHEGTVSAGIIMLSTLLSAITLPVWLYILRSMGLI
ncbi:MAG: AEC family transporter [Lachnospiraceae bacterium]|nr:AEC family transporter [Lachnospiraceae bacterium]